MVAAEREFRPAALALMLWNIPLTENSLWGQNPELAIISVRLLQKFRLYKFCFIENASICNSNLTRLYDSCLI